MAKALPEAGLIFYPGQSIRLPSDGSNGQVLTRGATSNDLSWTTVSGGGAAIARETLTQSVTVAAGASSNISLDLAATFGLMKVTADKKCRIRLYATASDRSSDEGRLPGGVIGIDSGLLAEFIMNTDLSIRVTPMVYGYNLESTVSNLIPARVTNDGATADLTLTFTYLPLETV